MSTGGKVEFLLDFRPDGTAEEIARLFPPPGYFMAVIDGAAVPDKPALMEALASAFKFPAYFGRNWDALLDCLRSLPNEYPADGYVLVVRNSGSLLSASEADREAFIDVAGEAAAFLRDKCSAVFRVVLL